LRGLCSGKQRKKVVEAKVLLSADGKAVITVTEFLFKQEKKRVVPA